MHNRLARLAPKSVSASASPSVDVLSSSVRALRLI